VVEQAKAATVEPDDPRYADLVGRGSRRFAGKPDYVRLVCSTAQVVDAVQDAVRRRLRVAVRSGGHCLENFVADPAVRVVIDTSLMTAVSYDPEMKAFAIEPGVRLGEAYRRLFLGWGVTIPAGVSPNVGWAGTCWAAASVTCAASTEWPQIICTASRWSWLTRPAPREA
jgi:FAD/FMN-containing dehydrogenase